MPAATITGSPTTASPATTLRQAAAALHERIAPLTNRATTTLGEIADYTDAFSRSDLRDAVRTGLDIGVGSMANPSLFAESGEHARSVGELRAREGFPLAAVAQAYRAGGQQIWLGLIEVTAEHAPARTSTLTQAAGLVWRHVDRDRELMTDAYRQACGKACAEAPRAALRTLLWPGADAIDITGAAVRLGLPMRGRYVVVRFQQAPIDSVPQPGTADHLDIPGTIIHRLAHSIGEIMVVELGQRAPAELANRLRCKGIRGGISSVRTSVADLACALAEADLAAATCTRDGDIAHATGRMAAIVVAARPELATALTDPLLRRVSSAEPSAAPQLWETLATWFDCEGNAADTAEALGCHRNTVTNRLRRLHEITGLDPAYPRDLANLAFALYTYRLHVQPR
ncbi:helix-turn-helix domain-containing protein [Gordonia sp. CPCC 205515]|uniref:PucR family transcriptional regulator n=1 Tax=Gordonia sp. CPCC 205515 TaxID=3140791 RepID=UPI003AF3FE0C